MRSLSIDNEPRALGKLELRSDGALIAFLGFSGIFGDELVAENSLDAPNKDVALIDSEYLRQQDKLILAELWNGLILGFVTYEQIQDFTGKSLFELEHQATIEPGRLQGYFVAKEPGAFGGDFTTPNSTVYAR